MKKDAQQEKHCPFANGSVSMKSYRQFISESVNISGNASVGTIIVGGQPTPQPVGEEFSADFVWQGSIYRIEMVTNEGLPSKERLAEQLQSEYPGAIVHNIYPAPSRNTNITKVNRYHPAKLDWI
jgi:hypothetical protein